MMKKTTVAVLLFLLGLFPVLSLAPADAAPAPLHLTRGEDACELGPHVEIMADSSNAFTLEMVRHDKANGFLPNTKKVISIGRSTSAFWFRFKLIPPGVSAGAGQPGGENWFLEAGKQGIGALDLYVPVTGSAGETVYQKTAFGTWRPPPANDIPSRFQVVSLPHTWDSRAYFYLKVKSDISINFPLRILSPRGFIREMLPDLYGFGILFGILIGMILYNFSIYLFLRDRTYLFYVCYIISMSCYLSLVYGHFDLIFNPGPEGMRLAFFSVCGATWFFSGNFSRVFLNTQLHSPVFDKLLLGAMAMGILVAGVALAGYNHLAHQLNGFLGMFCPPLAIVAAIRVWQKKFSPAKYFLAAWLILMTGLVLYSMGGIFIPRTPVTVYTVAVGAGIEAILLSLALADRIRLLQREKEALVKTEQQLRREVATDGMTGLYNRRFLLKALEDEAGLARKRQQPLSLLILDVDDFKCFNDTHGHPEGDKVLTALAGVLFDVVREHDKPCRYGGEEFVVILPETGQRHAQGVAERIRAAFSAMVFTPAPGVETRVSVSIGLAELKIGENGQELIRRADNALYRAKRQGKNRVISA